MPSAFHGIGTMNTALQAFQRALDVTGHNISNVDTPGYSRQRVHLGTADPTLFTQGGNFALGNGVNIQSISRIRDMFLVGRQLEVGGEQSRLGTLSGGLKQVEGVMMEMNGAGVTDALNKFFNSWSALGSDPTNTSLQQQVQQSAITLSSRIRGSYGNLTDQAKAATDQIKADSTTAQGLMNDIADLNRQIKIAAASGADPNDLSDLRDQKIRDLGQIVDVRIQQLPDASVNVYMGQLALVDQSGAATFPTNIDTTTGQVNANGTTYPIRGGSIAGSIGLIQQISSYQGKLDTLANTLRSQVNSVYKAATNSAGATNQNFFNDVTPPALPTGAIDFDVTAAIKADPSVIATGVSGNAGDGGIALSLSALRDTQIAALGGKTVSTFYKDFVAGVGTDISFADSLLSAQDAVSAQVEQQVQSTSGVSLDDEMSNMLRYQRSYQAAARALSIFDQTTEDLINLIH